MENNEKLRIQVRQQKLNIDQLRGEVDETKAKLVMDGDGKKTTGKSQTGMDPKGWKTAVSTRMYEGKISAMEEDMQRKVRPIWWLRLRFQH